MVGDNSRRPSPTVEYSRAMGGGFCPPTLDSLWTVFCPAIAVGGSRVNGYYVRYGVNSLPI